MYGGVGRSSQPCVWHLAQTCSVNLHMSTEVTTLRWCDKYCLTRKTL